MKIVDIKRAVSFIVCVVFLSLCSVSCNTEDAEEELAMEVIEPLNGDELSRRNNNKLIVRFNPDFVNTPVARHFSFDKKEWKEMTVTVVNREDDSSDRAVKYRHEVMLWKPYDDSLHIGDTVYIKVNSYVDETISYIVGPITFM